MLVGVTFVYIKESYTQWWWWRDPITINEDVSLNFGTILADRTGDRITIRPNGGTRIQNNSVLSGNYTAAYFSVYGDRRDYFNVTLPSSTLLTGNGQPMVLDNFSVRPNRLRFNRSGYKEIRIGARLTINPNQLGGSYSGSYTITIDYE